MGLAGTSNDTIYNGADDDASGTTAVLTLAHILATGPRPSRTIVFALFGSEEIGGFGNRAFLAHPPVPLTSIVANLEFEMIGRPDPAVPAGSLWLTGFDRSNLGPELAKHGAHLVADPHPHAAFLPALRQLSRSPNRASSPTPSPASACTRTTTNPPTNSAPSTSPT